MVNKEVVIKDFTEAMKKHYGDRLAKIILFGSYARGDFHEESDMDFMVLLKDEELKANKEIDEIAESISDVSLRQNIWVSAFPTSVKTYNASSKYIFHNIKAEGITVYGS